MSSVELYRLLLSRGASAHLSGGWLKSLWSIRLPLDFLRSQSLKCGCPLFIYPLFTRNVGVLFLLSRNVGVLFLLLFLLF